MSWRRRSLRPVPGLLLLFSLGCGAEQPDAETDRFGSRQSEIRPTDGSGWMGNGYGIPAKSHDSAGGHFRVFYVESGENAVDLTDEAPKNGVPDFVELVGRSAEATYDSTITRRGFRPPLDDSIYHDRPDYGGDARFDIYLRIAGVGSDGYRVSEVCTDGTPATMGGTPGRCSGYFVMNPGYKNSHYPSEKDGVEVLTSHELFHNVQDAYNAGQWRTFTEGTAVWNELQVFPDSPGTWRDYLGFLPAFFREPERPFDQSMGSGGAAAYAYGTAVFFQYLSERFGPQTIRQIWERVEQKDAGPAPHFLDATESVLREAGSSLRESWIEFSRWNLLTRERASLATPGNGYRRANEYPAVRLESDLTGLATPASFLFYGLSARYVRLRPPSATTVYASLSDPLGGEASALAGLVIGKDGMPRAGASLHSLSPDQATELAEGEALLLVLTSAQRGAKARSIELRLSPTPPMDQTPPPMSAGCALSASPPLPAPASAALLLLALLGLARRRLVFFGQRGA